MAIHAVSANDIWAVGDKGTILRWNGSSWSKVASPTTKNLFTVAMANANMGWAAGQDGAMLRWNGTQWSSVSSSTTNYIRGIALTPGQAATDGWAVADKYGVGQFLRTDGSTWKNRQGTQTFPQYGFTLHGIAIPTATTGWAVGETLSEGTMVAQGWSFDGSTWTHLEMPASKKMRAIAANGSAVWAVGDDGAMLRWDGAAWQAAAALTNMDLYGLAFASPTDGWAVGEGGVMLRWNGSTWQTAASPTGYSLRGVALLSPTAGWAVGEGGTILRWNGSAWTVYVQPQISRLASVCVTPSAGSDNPLGVRGMRLGPPARVRPGEQDLTP